MPHRACRTVCHDPAEIGALSREELRRERGRPYGVAVFLGRSAWDLRTTIEEWRHIRFRETGEQS